MSINAISMQPPGWPMRHSHGAHRRRVRVESETKFLLLFGHSSAKNARSEECTFGLLNHLLVDALRRMVHHHGACLVINLGIHLGVTDEVDNPLLALIRRQVQSG